MILAVILWAALFALGWFLTDSCLSAYAPDHPSAPTGDQQRERRLVVTTRFNGPAVFTRINYSSDFDNLELIGSLQARLRVLARLVTARTERHWLSVDELRKMHGISPSELDAILRLLLDAGLIERTRHRGAYYYRGSPNGISCLEWECESDNEQ